MKTADLVLLAGLGAGAYFLLSNNKKTQITEQTEEKIVTKPLKEELIINGQNVSDWSQPNYSPLSNAVQSTNKKNTKASTPAKNLSLTSAPTVTQASYLTKAQEVVIKDNKPASVTFNVTKPAITSNQISLSSQPKNNILTKALTGVTNIFKR